MKDNWKVCNVEESCDILDNMRIPLNGEQRAAIPGGIPYYGANGVQGYISKYLFDEDLILMAEDGGNFEEYSKRPIAYKIRGKSWVNNHAHILRAKKGYSQDYIFYSVVHKNIIPFIKGGTRSKLNLSDLKCVEIEFPPLPQQKKIAKILSTVDKVIEKTESAIAKYQAIKQGLMHDLFTRGIDVNTGKLRPTPQDAPELYKESVLGLIPRDWEVETLRDITNINQGLQIAISQRHKTEGENRFVYITIQYLNNLDSDSYKYYIENPTANVICNEDDILMVRTGNTGMIVTDIVGAFHNNFFKIDYNESVLKEFLVYFLKRDIIQDLILNYAGTTTIPDLKHSDFYKIPFNKPTIIEQKLIIDKLKAIDDKIQTEQQALAKYQQLKAGLLQDLLTGKVEVSVD